MAELFVFESSLQIVKKYLACMNHLTRKLLTRASIWIRLLVSWLLSKLAVDFRVKSICDKIFSIEYWTNSFKTELLSVILSHSGIEFDLLFNFTQSMTKSDWSFEKFWLTCFDYYAAGNSNCRLRGRQKSSKNKKFEANFSSSKTSYSTILGLFRVGLEKNRSKCHEF